MSQRERFGHQGTDSYAPIEQLKKYKVTPEASFKTVIESLVVHELIDEFRDEEDFSMMVEMLYVLEKGNTARVKGIHDLYTNKKLALVYEEGLVAISGWLGFDSVSEMLTEIQNMGLEQMKGVFKDKFTSYVKDLMAGKLS